MPTEERNHRLEKILSTGEEWNEGQVEMVWVGLERKENKGNRDGKKGREKMKRCSKEITEMQPATENTRNLEETAR